MPSSSLNPKSSSSRDNLIEKIINFITTYNRSAKPFRWTYDAKLLRAA